jgi:Protein of unknown function (DUF2934)
VHPRVGVGAGDCQLRIVQERHESTTIILKEYPHATDKPRSRSTSNNNATKSIPDLQALIRLRAYGRYEQRGREGNQLDDWLQAESDVTQPKAKTIIP